jgi:hypothetical protein
MQYTVQHSPLDSYYGCAARPYVDTGISFASVDQYVTQADCAVNPC